MYIKERRAALGITQEALAEQVGVGRSSVAHWETGRKTPTTDKLPDLARVLRCRVEDLFKAPEGEDTRKEAS